MEKILMVCLGNICRSPLAEGILREKFRLLEYEAFVDSAGIIAHHTGQHPDPRTLSTASKYNIDISSLKGRQIQSEDFDEFDIIYAMDKSIYDSLMMLAKEKAHKEKVILFMETQFPGALMDVPDPYFGGSEGFENVHRMIDEACEIIAAQIKSKKQKV